MVDIAAILWWWLGDGLWLLFYHITPIASNSWMVYHRESYSNGWFRGTPIAGNLHLIELRMNWADWAIRETYGNIIHQNPSNTSITSGGTPACRPEMYQMNRRFLGCTHENHGYSWPIDVMRCHNICWCSFFMAYQDCQQRLFLCRGTSMPGTNVEYPTSIPLWVTCCQLWIFAEVIWGAQVIIPDSPAQTAAWRTHSTKMCLLDQPSMFEYSIRPNILPRWGCILINHFFWNVSKRA